MQLLRVWIVTRSEILWSDYDFHFMRKAGFNQNVPKRLNVVKNKRGAVTKVPETVCPDIQ